MGQSVRKRDKVSDSGHFRAEEERVNVTITRKGGLKVMWYIGLVVLAGWLSSVNGLAQQHLNLERLKQDTEIFGTHRPRSAQAELRRSVRHHE